MTLEETNFDEEGKKRKGVGKKKAGGKKKGVVPTNNVRISCVNYELALKTASGRNYSEDSNENSDLKEVALKRIRHDCQKCFNVGSYRGKACHKTRVPKHKAKEERMRKKRMGDRDARRRSDEDVALRSKNKKKKEEDANKKEDEDEEIEEFEEIEEEDDWDGAGHF